MNMQEGPILENTGETLEEKVARLEEMVRQKDQRIEELEGLAYHDRLTGIKNRHALDEDLPLIFRMKTEGDSEQREGGQENNVCIVLFDIDHFQDVNNTYGHLAGDTVLAEVAERLKTSIRASDVIVRYGGEEILVILREASEYEAGKKADRLRKNIEAESFAYNGQEIPVTISGGVAFGNKDSDPQELIKRADTALYVSKNSGRNKVTISDFDTPLK